MAGLYLQSYSVLIGRGVFAFYMGALVYVAYQKLVTGGLVYRGGKATATDLSRGLVGDLAGVSTGQPAVGAGYVLYDKLY